MIKIVALLSMAIDHIGMVFFPDMIWMRIVGRLAMPAFAFGVSRSIVHYSEKGDRYINKYSKIILLYAFLAQIPFTIMGNTGLLQEGILEIIKASFLKGKFNILFMFWIFIIIAKNIQKKEWSDQKPINTKKFITGSLWVIIASVIFDKLVEYGAYGITLCWITLVLNYSEHFGISAGTKKDSIRYVELFFWYTFIFLMTGRIHNIQLFAVFSPFIIVLLKDSEIEKKIKVPKFISRNFYWAHMVLIILIYSIFK